MNGSVIRAAMLLAATSFCLVLPACTTAPSSRAERREMIDDAQTQLNAMTQRNSSLKTTIDNAAGYAVFPNVGKGGLLIGGAFGHGAVYAKGGKFLGYAKVTQASVGGIIGGRLSSQLLIFETEADLTRFTSGTNVSFGAEATAIAVETGTSATPQYSNGVAVYIMPRGGLMADASISGQQFAFEKRADVNDSMTRSDDGEIDGD